jgi:polyferredoxin
MINRLLRRTWFPLVAQLLTLAAFALLVTVGLQADTADMAFAKILRNTNVANLVVWSYWWPLIILSAIFFGRIWCMICPMELITSLAARFGLRRRPPRLLRSGWIITLFYVLVLFVGIHTLAIHRVPLRMALYLLMLLSTALVTGLLFSRNAFCAYVCPVGHLLGLYARLAPFGWGVRDTALCDTCKDQSCVANATAYEFQGRSCGVRLRPKAIQDNSECLLCGQCLKACDRNNPGTAGRPNPGWFRRRWFQDLLDLRPMTAAQTAFAVVVSGFVVYEVFTEWGTTKTLLLWAPEQVEMLLGGTGTVGHGLVTSLTLFVALPLLLWLLPYLLLRVAGGRLPLRDYWLRFGIAFLPIFAAAHVIKALLKTTSRIPYWHYAVADPLGLESARGLLQKTLTLAPLPPWRDPLITLVAIVVMAVGLALSVRVVRRSIAVQLPHAGWRAWPLYLIPALYGGGFATMVVCWRLLG